MAKLIARLFARISRTIAIPLVIACVPIFVLFSQTQLKETANKFLHDCLMVLQAQQTSNGHILVTGHLSGTPPKSLPLVFEGHDALINSISFEEAYREGIVTNPNDLAFHPLTGFSCPGPLCPEAGASTDRLLFPLTITDLHPDFTYRFRVRLKPYDSGQKLTIQNLKIYAIFDKGLPDGMCRVQPRRWFNFWVWATPLKKLLLFLTVIVVGSMVVRWASTGEKDQS